MASEGSRMNTKPKILFWDLETSPNVVTSWGLFVGGMLSPNNIVQERTIICGSWKWAGRKGTGSVCVHSSAPADDRTVVQELCNIIRQADAVVAHNGDKFDLRWLNARAVYYGFPPLPAVIQIDTLKIAKAKFKFNSNKLEYLATYLKVGKKIKTEFDLWKRCMAGDVKALLKMVRYNRRDIVILERVYKRLVPFVPAKVNAQLFGDRPACPSCGKQTMQSRGFSYTVAHKYRRFHRTATGCGHWTRGR